MDFTFKKINDDIIDIDSLKIIDKKVILNPGKVYNVDNKIKNYKNNLRLVLY